MNPIDPSDPTPELFQPRPSPMNEPGLAAATEKIQHDTEEIRSLLHAGFVALIFLTLGLNLFLWKQMRDARDQLDRDRTEMERAETLFRQRDPEFKRIVSTLLQYGGTHPDYNEILIKYRGVLPQYFPGTPALSAKPENRPLPLPLPPAPAAK